MRIADFEWDEGNVSHIQVRHGVEPEEAEEEVFTTDYVLLRARYGRCNALGYTESGRLLSIFFEEKGKGRVRVITARDMEPNEVRYFKRQRG